MSTLRGFVYRVISPNWPQLWPASRRDARGPWAADIGDGSWNDPDWEDEALTNLAHVTAEPNGESGHVIAYSLKPMVCIKHFDGAKSWHVAEKVHPDPWGLTFEEAERIRELSAESPTISHAALYDLVLKVKTDTMRKENAKRAEERP